MIRIAFIDNVSSAAFTVNPPRFPVKWTCGTPTDIFQALTTEAIDAGLLSTVRLPDVERTMEPLGTYGIACRGAVSSVLFFGKRPLADLLVERAPIFLSEESQTARRLFDVLCRHVYNHAPVLHPDSATAEGILRIGNDALNADLPEQRWPAVLDLGQWWYETTGLPFVFARWVVRRSMPPQKKTALLHWLDATERASRTPGGHNAMARRHPGVFPTIAQAARYFDRLQHRLTVEHFAGLKAFLQMDRFPGAPVGTTLNRRTSCEQSA